eukprot:gene12235-15376_t
MNLHKLMGHYLSDKPSLWATQGTTPQLLMQSLFRDLVHLRREQLGTLWVSDLIINWMLR